VITLTYEVRDDNDETVGGRQIKTFENDRAYYGWLNEQAGHPWLSIHVISREASLPDPQ